MNIVTSALGHYEPRGCPADADVVIGHSFGTIIDDGGVNRELADFIFARAEGRPIIVDRTLANAFPDQAPRPDHVVEGSVTDQLGQGVGTWGTLAAGKAFMAETDLRLALQVGHACHIGRISMQARKLAIPSVIPSGLPQFFDKDSEQPWTRSLAAWLPREIIGSWALRAQGRL